ncbi:gliding motility-associated C-terminal domain-containing protein [Membranihabitans maritimus]|uniref:gliding motility-associated C-terminal domain-containing protein n=1 Tax=Membranihabitans maritimus TaxID=2904244 RepID=UPI001F213C79|nr:gliding motility-associated C-terminal domain-containing protein [Membranihabitans maritimus]
MWCKIIHIFLFFIFLNAPVHSWGQVNTGEICDNGIDDNEDGLIDLNDPDCDCQTSVPPSHIPNPSFEEIDCCPSGNSQLNCAKTWIQASEATTDYMNRCGYFERDQFPLPKPIPDGDAYIGFRNGRFTRNPEPNWKEYTGACLNSPLEAGTQYTFQFHIGFVDRNISPPMDVVLYGTTDCKNLPFGVGDRSYGCPTNGSGWKVLGKVYVSGSQEWRRYEITTTPAEDIAAIAIGPDCIELDLSVNPYYFLDNLILANSQLFGPTIEKIGHPCNPEFGLLASERQNVDYQWYRDGIAIVGATDRFLQFDQREGKYQVMIMTGGNCVLSAPYDYIIPTFETQTRKIICPDATFAFGEMDLNRSGSYTHTFTTRDGCDSTVHMDLTVLTESVDTVQEYFFKGETFEMGPYRFNSPTASTFPLVSSIGCDSLVHLILDEYDIYIPNAFSPNGDGLNDTFTIYGNDALIKVQSMRIFDRWGNRVYQQDETQPVNWNGTNNGKQMESGVYGYLLDLILYDGSIKVLSGDITLLR